MGDIKIWWGGAVAEKWTMVQTKVTDELCDDELDARRIEFIESFFPEKKRLVTIESNDSDIAGPRKIVIKRDPRITWRFFQIQ